MQNMFFLKSFLRCRYLRLCSARIVWMWRSSSDEGLLSQQKQWIELWQTLWLQLSQNTSYQNQYVPLKPSTRTPLQHFVLSASATLVSTYSFICSQVRALVMNAIHKSKLFQDLDQVNFYTITNTRTNTVCLATKHHTSLRKGNSAT